MLIAATAAALVLVAVSYRRAYRALTGAQWLSL